MTRERCGGADSCANRFPGSLHIQAHLHDGRRHSIMVFLDQAECLGVSMIHVAPYSSCGNWQVSLRLAVTGADKERDPTNQVGSFFVSSLSYIANRCWPSLSHALHVSERQAVPKDWDKKWRYDFRMMPKDRICKGRIVYNCIVQTAQYANR